MNANRLSAKLLLKVGALLAVILTVTGCGPGQFPDPTMTPIPTNTPVPTATNSPAPTLTPTIVSTASARPTQIPDQTIFSDTFEDNRNDWVLSGFTKIEDGLMQINSGDYELAAIKIPLESTPHNVAVQVDIIPNPPADADPSAFAYGVGCRLNETGNDFFFFGVSPAPGVDGFFMATFMQFKGAKMVDYELLPIELPESQAGNGFTATFLCSDTNFKILSGQDVVAEVTSSDFAEGHLFLGIYKLDSIAGSVRFDNLTVSEVK